MKHDLQKLLQEERELCRGLERVEREESISGLIFCSVPSPAEQKMVNKLLNQSSFPPSPSPSRLFCLSCVLLQWRKSFPAVQGTPALDGRGQKWEQNSTSATVAWIDWVPEECGKGTGLEILPEGFAKSVQAEQRVGIVPCHLFKPQSVHCRIEGFYWFAVCAVKGRDCIWLHSLEMLEPQQDPSLCIRSPKSFSETVPSKRMKEEGLLLPPAVSPSVWLLLSEMAHRKGAGTPLQPLRKCFGLTHCLKPCQRRDNIYVMTGISFSFLKESHKILGMNSVMKITLTAKRCLSSEQCLHTS